MKAIATRGPSTLAELAPMINYEHSLCAHALERGLEHAIRAGLLLLQAKEFCGHGRWLQWLDDNFEGSARTANAYMRVASNPQRVADLSFRGALRMLGGEAAEAALHRRAVEVKARAAVLLKADLDLESLPALVRLIDDAAELQNAFADRRIRAEREYANLSGSLGR